MRGAVLFAARGAFLAVAFAALAGFTLRADADPVADLEVAFCLRTDADDCADDFMADAAGIGRGTLCSLAQILMIATFKVEHTHPLRNVCKSLPQIPQQVTLISTSVSSHGLGSNSCQTM